MEKISYALKKFLLDICDTAITYKVDHADIEKILSYQQPVRIGSSYTKSNIFQLNCRGISGRSPNDYTNVSSIGEFYKNSILGMVKNLPVYDGNGEWLDVESFTGELDYAYHPIHLIDRCPRDPRSLVFGTDYNNNSELRFVEINEFREFSDSIKCEAFGNTSYCQIHSLVDMVKECYAETGKKVLIVELGPGIGYWINRVGSILNDLNIPFVVLALEYYFFNAVNTLRMAKYFGNKGKILSVMADIHEFDWYRFSQDFAPIHQCPIVVHSSGCLNYVNSQAIDGMLSELSKFNLYGGCHFEGDAFTLYDSKQKKLFLEVLQQQNKIFFPQPILGMTDDLRRKAGISMLSYLDPLFQSSVITAINNLKRFLDVDVKITFPWAPLHFSPMHYTEWRVKF